MRSREELSSTQRATSNEQRATLLVGREVELQQLQRSWGKVLDGTRQVVFVSGEPGIGKTTLIDVFLSGVRCPASDEEIHKAKINNQKTKIDPQTSDLGLRTSDNIDSRPPPSDPLLAHGQCVEQYGAGEAYLPLLEATTRLCRGAEREQCIAAMRQYAPSWLLQLPGLLTPEDHALLQRRVQGTNRERMLREMAEAAEQFSAQRALIIVLEDLHWSDVATLDWLAYIARRREPARLLILGTYRPTDVLASNHPLRAVVQELQARQQCEEIPMLPLGKQAVTAYLTQRFALNAPDDLAASLVRRTGGNPLFLVNTVDYLIDQQIVRNEVGQWMMRADAITAVNEGIPETLRQLVEYQVDRLSEEDVRMLEVASVVGVEFAVAEVAAGLPGHVERLEVQCEHLARTRQFLRTDGVDEWPDGTLSGRYSFVHAVYQEVISARVGGVRRIQLHRRFAERKEAAYGERTAEVAAELAVHFEHGRELAKAVQYCRQAGEVAARASAPQEALSHFKRGLELLSRLPDSRERSEQEVKLQLALTNPLYAIGGRTALDEMERAYLRAHELCQNLGTPPQLASVLFGLGMVYELRGEVQKGKALAEQLLTFAQKEQNPALLLRAHMALGNVLYFLGEFSASRYHLEQGLAVYDPHKHSPRVSNVAQDLGVVCLSRAGWVLWCLGYPEQARRSSDQGLALAHELSHYLSETFALDGAIGVAQVCGDVPAVEQRVARLISLSQERSFPYSYAWGRMVQGWLVAGKGHGDEGIAQLHQGLTSIRQGGQDLGIAYFRGLLAEACATAGRISEGLAVVADALTIGQRYGEQFYDAELYRLKGQLTLEAGGWRREIGSFSSQAPRLQSPVAREVLREAEEHFFTALTLARHQHAKSFELRAAISMARLWQHQGKDAEARHLLEEIYSWFTEGFDTKDLQEAAGLLRELGSTLESQKLVLNSVEGSKGKGQRAKVKTEDRDLQQSGELEGRRQEEHTFIAQSFLQTQPLTLRTQHPAPSVVGRDAELTFLHDHWTKAQNGVRQAVFLSGEPGIGKTTLIDVFLSGVRRPASEDTMRPESRIQSPESRKIDLRPLTPDPWLAHGQCVEQYGAGEAYLPILEALGRLGREPGKEDVVTILAQYAPTWLAQLPALVPVEKREEFQHILTSATRVRMLRELAEALEVLSAQRLLVLVLEDLHWSDPSTVELLAYLLRRQGLAHLFIIGTYRPADIITTDHPLKRTVQELQGRGHCEVLQLELLPEAAVATYLHRRFGEMPNEFARALHQRTDGNPLFMVATVEHLMREGIVVPDGARWRITQDLPALQMEVPENLRQLIATQLDGLRSEEQRLLEVASIAGAEFTVAILAAELNESREMLEAQCANLAARRQFLRSTGTEQLADGVMSGRYGFVHALYQRVIYEQIAEARRMQLHCRIGEHKEHLAGAQAPELASELAIHFETGGDYPRAVRYLALAGETAIRRQAHHEAIRHLSKGLALLCTLPVTPEHMQTELSLHLALGVPLIVTQGWAAPQVGQVYRRAYELCQQIGTPIQLYSVVRGLELFYMTRTEYAKARELAEQLLSLAQQMQNPALLVGAHMAMGQVRFFTAEFRPALEHLEHGIALIPQQYDYQSWSGGHPGISSLGYGAWALWFLGYPDQALQMSQEALRLAREEAHPFTLALCLQFAAKLHQVRREAQATQSRAEENVALSRTHGFTPFVAMETHMRGWALAVQGHYDEGLALMRQIQDAWRAVGMNFGRTYFLAVLAETCGAMEQFDEGVQAVTEALALVEQTDERQSEAELYRLKGELTLAGVRGLRLETSPNTPQSSSLQPQASQGTLQEVEEYFHKALAIARQQQAKSLELRAVMSLARLWQSQGKQEEARDLLQNIYDWFTEGFDTRDLQEAAALLVMLGGSTKKQEAKIGPDDLAVNPPLPSHPVSILPSQDSTSESNSTQHATWNAQSLDTLDSASMTPDTGHGTSDAVFRSEGDYWTLVFRGTTRRIRDTRGMHYLAQLLRHPEREFSALTLAADSPNFDVNPLAAATLMSESRDPAAATMHIAGFTDAGEVLDPQAKAEYRQRLKEIEAELEEAREFNDVGRIEKLQDELEFVTQELMGAVGLRGRARKSASPQERARVNVTRAIRTAITRIAEGHSALGQYLTQTIKTGTFCSYVPEAHTAITWDF